MTPTTPMTPGQPKMRSAFLFLCVFSISRSVAGADGDTKTLKVFILSGQSNMVGWSHVRTLPALGQDPAYAALFQKLARGKGEWVERDDVFIDSTADDRVRKGRLSVGYGGGGAEWLGPEFAFGVEMGDLYSDPVLLIKAAWGGKDLYCDFRPPSAGDPAYDIPLADGVPREVGASYRKLVQEVHRALDDVGENFPMLKHRDVELAGFVWFQGWNEMFANDTIQEQVYAEYPSNVAHLVADLRQEFGAPDLPVVVGEMGVGGDHPGDRVEKLRAAQQAILAEETLRGSVALARTTHLWDGGVDQAFNDLEDVKRTQSKKLQPQVERGLKSKLKGMDDEERKRTIRNETDRAVEKTREFVAVKEAFDQVGSHWACHYHGSAKMYCVMGQAFAQSLYQVSHRP